MREKFLTEEDLQINDLRFTSRKVDILSCICGGCTLKTISNLLGISLNTVNTHIDQLFKATKTYSKEQLARFCERSSAYSKIQKRYREIVLFSEFEQVLKKIAKLHISQKYVFHVVGEERKRKELLRLEESILITSMKLAGIEVQISYEDDFTDENGCVDILCVRDTSELKKEYFNHKYLIIDNNELIAGDNKYDKYLPHIEALSAILPENARKILEDFKNALLYRQSSEKKEKKVFWWREKMISALFSIIVAAVTIIAVSSFCIKLYLDDRREVMSNLYYASSNVLSRRCLVKEIDKAIKKDKHDIKVVVLAGHSGAGKTTIARNFIKNESAAIKFEINAESKQSIIDSFYNIATMIADKRGQQGILSNIKSATNSEERTRRVIAFVQSHLKQFENWYLLFDNVDEIETVKEYFPVNSEIWGKGVVIITTRNENIENCDLFCSSVVQVGELSTEEQYQLFCSILYGESVTSKTKEIEKFLSKIPKYPLDVSSAAYFIKNTNMGFSEYLKHINTFSEDFEKLHSKIVSECMEYDKTRNGIIASSFNKIMQKHSDYRDLLLLVCFVDSQEIPVKFLEKYKGKITANAFVRELKRFSVVTERDEKLFIHRSTQNIGLRYVLSTLSSEEKVESVGSVVRVLTPLEDFCWFMYRNNSAQGEEGFSLNYIPHLEALNRKLHALHLKEANKYTARIVTALGHIYHMHGNMISMATANYKKALEMKDIRKYITDYDYAVLLAMLGYDLTLFGDMKSAEKHLNDCCLILKDLPNNEALQSMTQVILSLRYERVGEFAKAIETSEQALKVLDGFNEKWSDCILVQAYYCILTYHARRYLNASAEQECLRYAQKIFDIYDAIKRRQKSELAPYPLFACHAKFTLAAYYNMLGQYKEALKEYSVPNENFMKQYPESEIPLSHKCYLAAEKNYSLVWLNDAETAEKNLSDAIEKLKFLNNSKILIFSVFYRIEARIMLGKLDEAYEDCKFAISFKRWNMDNTSIVRRNTCHYHAAVVKLRQKNDDLALKHFRDFFTSMKEFCKNYLEKAAYEKLLNEKVFECTADKSLIDEYLQNSSKIFAAIYGENHNFVKNYTKMQHHPK